MKRTPLKRGTKPLERRTPLNPIGRRAKREAPDRKLCREVVIARDKVCQFPVYFERCVEASIKSGQFPKVLVGAGSPCWGPPQVHEPAHRRNSDVTDPEQCILLCQRHNQWLEDHPQSGYALGLLVRGNGLPLRGSY